jgi:ribosome-associated protein
MTVEQQIPTPEELSKYCATVAEDRKAEDIAIIKIGNVSLVADYFVICTGSSQPHINAIAEWTRRKVRESFNIRPLAIDGKAHSQWVVIDYGNVIFHILSTEAREKYQLEDLWGDAERVEKILSDRLTCDLPSE